ncbi:MAG TPA: ATP-binding cassette domain-containing protein [Firmicutes bacterium]|nr:ATP-binding cassette domain-containing protein [Candidatus Fermentithermobacillaceae bacterium]
MLPVNQRSESVTFPRDILIGRDIRVFREGREILTVPEITVREGEVLAVIGPNGAGKTTLLSVLACLEFPHKGRVFFRGVEVSRKNALGIRRRMAAVFQEPLLLDGTVLDNVELGLRLRGLKAEARPRAMEWLSRLGLEDKARQSVHTLSGGEAQRVALARAFVLEPEVLFLDEPFSSVDAIARRELIGDLRDIVRATRVTTVLVTHDFREVRHLATRVLVLNQGRIEAEGRPEDVSNHPRWGELAN